MGFGEATMLEPQSRRHLMEALRPPPDYTLDRAIGTTFTLDLLTLLTVPLSFTLFGWEDEDGSPASDPLTLFESLRRHSDRIAVFCQAGRIAVPTSSPLLLGYLEDTVVEVTPRTPGRIFHPKVWILRFISDDGSILYRLLVASRNLTFDRSWDTLLALEGTPDEQESETEAGLLLARFAETLPQLATSEVAPGVWETVNLVSGELGRVSFQTPPGFTGLDFWPLGLDNHRPKPFGRDVERMLCVSPFVTNGLLNSLPGREKGVLVSRAQELDKLQEGTLDRFAGRYVLRQEAEDDEPDAEGAGDGRSKPAEDEGERLRGLHAKLYVADAGSEARIWTGSANATHAAFSGNVEFLVELRGNRGECGIDRILHGVEGETSFRQLLQEYVPPEPGTDLGTDPEQEKLEAQADEVRGRIAAVPIWARVSGFPNENGRYAVELQGSPAPNLDEGAIVQCRPITLGPDRSVPLKNVGPNLAEFDLSLEAITAFFVFEVNVTRGAKNLTRSFVVNAPLVNAPEGRKDAVLSTLLSDPRRIMRLILMLLAEVSGNEREIAIALGGAVGQRTPGNGKAPSSVEIPLFEELVRALWNNPRALDRIDGMLAAVRREGGDHLVPEELGEIWPQIMNARSEIKRGRA